MHLIIGSMGLALVLMSTDVTTSLSQPDSAPVFLAAGSTLATYVSTDISPFRALHSHAYLKTARITSPAIQSVDEMLQGLKQNQLWDEGDNSLLEILGEHWRWIVYLIFFVLVILLLKSIQAGRKRKFYTIKNIHHDMLEPKPLLDAHTHQGLRDALTGLPNRTLFLDRLQHAISSNARSNQSLAIVIIDLDQFKRINDSLGHHAGDRILKIVSERFMEVVRKSDTIARLGGDEFIVLVQGVNEADNVIAIVQKMISVLSEPIALNGEECKVGASVGISVFPQHGSNSEDLLRRADLAMYKAKYTGDSILMYDESFDILESSLQG